MRPAGPLPALAATLLLAACMGPEAPAAPPPHPVAADGSIHVGARPVPLEPGHPERVRIGELVYAGGLELTSADTGRLHGISGLDVAADGVSFIANTDEGDLVTGRLVLGPDGRLAGVSDVRLRPLRDEQGRELQGKTEGDAEDITWLPGGRFAVSFERDHRILVYDHPGGAGRLLWRHSDQDHGLKLENNSGIEALTADEAGELTLGSEDGDIRRLEGRAAGPDRLAPEPPQGYKLTGLDTLSGRDWAAMYRAWDPVRGARAAIAVLTEPRCIRAPCIAPHGLRELAQLGHEQSIDNFEGIAATPLPGGRWRLYIISDDNFSAAERTLLLAFDWDPRGQAQRSGSR